MNKSGLRRFGRNLTRWISVSYLHKMKRRIGALETVVDAMLTSPRFVPDEKNAFNGQKGRQEIFKELTNQIQFDCIVETGTFLGNTTGWMNHMSGLPVYSSEINRMFYLVAQKRLEECKDVHLAMGDSTEFLQDLKDSDMVGKKAFFYLDAHWGKRLPLAEEFRIIAENFTDFVIMVDDFQVPWDNGYGFDDYGFRNTLTVGCFKKVFRELCLVAYFPILPSTKETGAGSGCVILTKMGSNVVSNLNTMKTIRYYTS